MITDANIENFKGIKKCQISDLAKINLFIGKNNCGKSNILEAIYLSGKEYFSNELTGIIQRGINRLHMTGGGRELWYDYQLSNEIKSLIRFDDDELGIRVLKSGEHIVTAVLFSDSFKDVNFYAFNDGKPATEAHKLEFPFKNSKSISEYFKQATLIDSNTINAIELIEKELSPLVLSSREKKATEDFAEIYSIDEDMRHVEHPDYNGNFRLVLSESGKRRFIDDWGDGTKYGLSILLNALNIRNSGLFIDEIESHQHPEALKKLISKLVNISKEQNLQLFITTQSYETYRYLKAYCREDDFQNYVIERNSDTGIVTTRIEEDITKIRRDIFGIN